MREQNAPEHVTAARLAKPHAVVVETKRQYRGVKPYDGWRKPTNSGLIEPPAGGTAHLHVAPASLDRALRLADVLLKAAEARGHTVALDTAGEYAGIVVAGQFVGFQLREGTKRFPHLPTIAEERQRKRNPYALIPEWEHRPTGVLTFEIDQNRYDGTRRRWSEGESLAGVCEPTDRAPGCSGTPAPIASCCAPLRPMCRLAESYTARRSHPSCRRHAIAIRYLGATSRQGERLCDELSKFSAWQGIPTHLRANAPGASMRDDGAGTTVR